MTGFAAQSGPIQRLVIVGGGTAGWMAAIYLNRIMRAFNRQVILVESPTLGTIGVGEATIPPLVHFFRGLKLDEKELMRKCSATYKLGIKFVDWAEPGKAYWHPFGHCGARIDNLDLFHFWLRRRIEAGSKLEYEDYSTQVRLGEAGKAPWPYGGASLIQETASYAYHLDASALADYLRDIATREGVQHLFGDVRDVALDQKGDIESVDIGGDRIISGDFFIDATGFSGRLIEQKLADPWIDWSRHMLCDRAVVMPLPRGEDFPPYTYSTAREAGWTWQIPLNSRTGFGYVHSSAHISTEAATETLIAQAGLRKARAADPRVLPFRVGRRTSFWRRNCVSIGLASGFVEPLESTGIHLIQFAIMLLSEYFPDRSENAALRRVYNSRMGEIYDAARDFIILHYYLSRREEPFWRASREVTLPDSLTELLELYDETSRIDSARLLLFPASSYYFILAGNGRVPRRTIVEAEQSPTSKLWHVLDRIRADGGVIADRMPAHKDYMAELHRTSI